VDLPFFILKTERMKRHEKTNSGKSSGRILYGEEGCENVRQQNKAKSGKEKLDDPTFFDELRKTRRDYGIRKAKISNDVSRRRIAKLVLDCFLRYHPLQYSLCVDDFQILGTLLESTIYQELNNLSLICKEPIDEEIRLVKEAKMSKKEAQQWALKLTSGIQDLSEDLDTNAKYLINTIIEVLRGEKDNGTRRAKTSKSISRKIDNIGDTSGTIRL